MVLDPLDQVIIQLMLKRDLCLAISWGPKICLPLLHWRQQTIAGSSLQWDMAIQSTTFGRIELSGKEAERFQRHMTEDKPNLAAKASLARGQTMLACITSARQGKSSDKR
jgi:hypothetical protein